MFNLDSVAKDYLRFTMRFFQLIQQSAQHIYHSALPLSPKSSIFPSLSLPEETRISDFHGRPDHWGAVVRTITSIPGGFSCITTIGRGSTAKIAGACDDGTVRIYDSVTGLLKLSLRPEFPVLEITGLPDGSLLVCTHNERPSITLWDIQTGGLVQTFILKGKVKHTTVSLNGRYLACETFTDAVIFWETASRMQNPDPWKTFCGNWPCWLAPEELIMVEYQRSVYIRSVVTRGLPVYTLDVPGPVHAAVYSPIFDRLVIMSSDPLGRNTLIIPDYKTDASSTLCTASRERLSSIAFSQTTKELVCCWGAPGLETIDISTGCLTRFDLAATVTSVSTLSNGIVVANVQGSGIQLLSLGQERASPGQSILPPLAMYPLDKGRIIVIVSATNDYMTDHITLLETATMSQVLSIHTQEALFKPAADRTADRTAILYASLENGIAVCCLKGWSGNTLEMWEFSHQNPRWTVPTRTPPSVGSISPACTRLVTLHIANWGVYIHVWDASNGTLVAQTSDNNLRPIDVTFDSEDRFYIHYNTHRETYDIDTETWAGNPTTTHHIIRRAGQQLGGQVLEKRYSLDDDRKWVFCDSQRICWVPPGYVGSAPASHCWAGSSLVMVGQDGMPRKLTFVEQLL